MEVQLEPGSGTGRPDAAPPSLPQAELPDAVRQLSVASKVALLTMGRALQKGEVLEVNIDGYISNHRVDALVAATLRNMVERSNFALLDALERDGVRQVF